MINKEKWVDSLPKQNMQPSLKEDQIDNYRWVNTIAKKRICFRLIGLICYSMIKFYLLIKTTSLLTGAWSDS